MSKYANIVIAVLLFLLLFTPSLRSLLERTLITHVLLQLPLLVMIGMLLATSLPISFRKRLNRINEKGLAGLLIVLFTLVFWMLPRSLDAALDTFTYEVAKFLSLPLLIGIPLAMSWPQLGLLVKGFLITNLLSMLAVLGWLYTCAPIRLCNYYLLDQQALLGQCFFVLAGLIAVYWVTRVFIGHRTTVQ